MTDKESQQTPTEVIEVEVERLPLEGEQGAPELVDVGRRFAHGFGPVLAGFVIDVIDFTLFGAVGLVLGFPIGAAAGYWLARRLGLPRRVQPWIALASGLYCMFPPTFMIPGATLLGVLARSWSGPAPESRTG